MNSLAVQLHQLFNAQKRFTFPFEANKNEIPTNGIYIIFEKGEKFNDCDRIIRVGTHTGDNQLYSRLKQHFVKENKNPLFESVDFCSFLFLYPWMVTRYFPFSKGNFKALVH